jgi:hypothetical protein
MNLFINKHNLLYPNQFGFRKFHSTELALTKLLDIITNAIDSKLFSCCVFIDLRKAFDTINLDILLAKLEYLGFRGHFHNLIKSYLSNRSQYVSFNGTKSNSLPITHGVPQGSILGPLLFLLYINDLHLSLRDSSPILFADDNSLPFQANTVHELFNTVNSNLLSLHNWLSANKLTINTQKSSFILFKPYPKSSIIPPILINNYPLQRVTEVTSLGVILDENLSFKSHLTTLKHKLTSSYFIFSKIRINLPISSAWLLYFAIFKSHLNYCITLWGSACSTYLSPINILHNKFLKSLLFLPKKTNTVALYKKANVLNLTNLYHYAILSMAYKLCFLPESSPSSLSSLFIPTSSLHHYSTHANCDLKLFIKPCSTSSRHNSISIQGPALWNSLPLSITNNSLSLFTSKLKSNLLHSQ